MPRTRKYRSNKDTTRIIKGGADKPAPRTTNVFDSLKLSTQQNTDANYVESGLIHMSESQGINVARGAITGISNFFGAKGVDNTIYDTLRNQTLQKLSDMLQPDEKVCNLRMEFDNPTPTLLYHHAYGTIIKRNRNPLPQSSQGTKLKNEMNIELKATDPYSK